MIYSIFAAVVFTMALGLMITTDYRGSFTDIKYRGRTYYRKVRPLFCKVKALSWGRNGEPFIVCNTESNKPDIELFMKMDSKNVPYSVWLMETETREGKLYFSAPADVPDSKSLVLRQKEGEKEISIKEGERLSSILKKVYVVLWTSLAVAFLFIGIIPLLSIVLSAMVIAVSLRNMPFKNWTRNKACSIIKEKTVHTSDDNIGLKLTRPSGYNEWTDVEKELFDIESRAGAKMMAESEVCQLIDPGANEMAAEYEKEDSKNIRVSEDKILCSDKTEEGQKNISNNIVTKVCYNCGCIVDEDDAFCSQCGNKLENSKSSFPTQSVQPIENTQNIGTSPINKDLTNQNIVPQQMFGSNKQEQDMNKKKNWNHRSRKGNFNGTNSELSNVLAAAEKTLF